MRTTFVLLFLGFYSASSYAALGAAPSNLGVTPSARVARSLAAASTAGASASAAYTVNASTLASGTVVREYSGSAGLVFAVSWSGPFKPDLRTLLGTHFTTMTDDASSRPKAGRPQLRVAGDDIVIEAGGHMGAFSGRAWIPSALPSGFTSTDIE